MSNPVIPLPSATVPPVSPGAGRTSESHSGPLPVIVLILLWGYIVYRLGTLWHSNDDYAFGWFVPLLMLCLLWERWKRRPSTSPVRPAGGTLLLFGLFVVVMLPAVLFLEIIPNWRFAGWIFAGAAIGINFIIFYFLGGRSWSRFFAFPVIFFLIAVPWPTRLEQPLIDKMSRLNAAASTATANVLGTPAVRRGVLIETSPGLVGVDEACSGIRSFQSSVMVALFLGELFSYGILRRGVLLIGAVGLAFSCNVIRTTYLVRIADLHGMAAVNLHHDQAGLTILGITLCGLLILVWLLRPKRKSEDASLSSEASRLDVEKIKKQDAEADSPNYVQSGISGSVNPIFIKVALTGLVLWIVLIEMGIHFWFHPAEKEAATLAVWSLKLPAQAAEFSETPVSKDLREMLSYDEARKAEWRDSSGSVWQLYYFRWLPAENRYRAIVTGSQAHGHAPDICLRNAGMVLQTNLGMQTVTVNNVHLDFDTELFLDQGRNFHVFSCCWEPNNEWVPQTEAGTIMAVRSVLHALETRDRGWKEKRVLKLGVWGKDSDESAQAVFRQYLQAMIAK